MRNQLVQMILITRTEFIEQKRYQILRTSKRFKQRVPQFSDINNGFCNDFAQRISEQVDGAIFRKEQVDGVPHCFVEFENRFYDATAPAGVENWKDLEVFQYATLDDHLLKDLLDQE